MRCGWLLIGILAGTPLMAQGLDTGFADLSIGSSQGAAPQQRFAVETDWSLGAVGLQIGAFEFLAA